MKVNRCVLDGQTVKSTQTFYDEIARQLSFPSYFGRNLDALWDVLTVDIEGPIEIVWNGSRISHAIMGHEYKRLVALLTKVGKERKDFQLLLK